MGTFFNRGEDTCSTKAKHELIITSEREDGVIQFFWRNYRSFDEAIHTQACLYIFTLIAYLTDRMADGKLEIFAYVRVEAHDVDILNGLILSWFVVETHSLCSTSATDCVALWASLHRQTDIPSGHSLGITFALSARSATTFVHRVALAYRLSGWRCHETVCMCGRNRSNQRTHRLRVLRGNNLLRKSGKGRATCTRDGCDNALSSPHQSVPCAAATLKPSYYSCYCTCIHLYA